MTSAPAVRYVRTSDGVSIAYSVAGAGPLLVMCDGPYLPLATGWGERAGGRLSERFRVARFDTRGIGMSDRDALPASLDDQVRDLEAVIDALSEQPVALLGYSYGAHAALAYASQSPERVSRLVLYGSPGLFQSERSPEQLEYDRTIDGMVRQAMGRRNALARLTLSTMMMQSATPEAIEERTAELEENVSSEAMQRYVQISRESKVEILLDRLTAPTLVMHRERETLEDVAGARQIAAAIAGAQLRMLGGTDHLLLPGQPELDQFVEEVGRFLAVDEDEEAAHLPGFQTILFTDLESSTALTQRVGDEAAQVVLRGHNVVVRGALEEHGGREVKHTGDGIMASFRSAVRAVQAGIAIQREMMGAEVRVRVGLNAGEPIAEDDDLFGTAVQLAARITDRAEPGQVLVSRVVMELCAGKTFEFTSIGEATLKGFTEPVTLYEVRA